MALFRSYSRLLHERPMLTNFVTGLGLGFVGDVFCQRVIEGKEWKDFDKKRAFAVTTFSAWYSGGVTVKIFALYPRIFPRYIMESKTREGIFSSLVDNLVHSPLLYLPAFYLWTGKINGESTPQIVDKFKTQFPSMMTSLLLVWMPVQFLNFSVVPRNQRVLFCLSANLVWNSIMDFIKHQDVSVKQPVLL